MMCFIRMKTRGSFYPLFPMLNDMSSHVFQVSNLSFLTDPILQPSDAQGGGGEEANTSNTGNLKYRACLLFKKNPEGLAWE